jgi:hypothetical protein
MDMFVEVLEKFATESGNEEVVNAVNGIKETYRSNLERVKFLEGDLQKSIEKRDHIKNMVRNKLGVEELNEDSIDGVLARLKSTPEVDNMNKVIESLRADKESLSSEYKKTVNLHNLERKLLDLGAIEDTENAKAYDIVLKEISKTVAYDDNGNILFQGSDGLTLRNQDGSPITMSDMYKQIKDSEEFAFLFKTKRSKQGSGATGNKSGGQTSLKRSEMSYSEKGKFIEQFGQDAYLKLLK